MNVRYLSNLALALIAGFLVVATQGFALPVVKWLVFSIATGATIISIGTLVIDKNIVQRAVSLVAGIVGGWTIVASLVFGLSTVMWLGFAGALALIGLAVIGLTAHELTTERVVHSLDVEREPSMRPRDPIAA